MTARSANNIVYWLRDPLDPGEVAVLRRIKSGRQSFFSNRLSVAYLVARGCVSADLDKCKLVVTDKGDDALAHYEER
ncbi:MAG TPA: hypothetical protein VFA98_12680 [Thermoanaerobaculia bacterium]|jgi:hypothetical protein|nr:hypothetical protein [Thermoanaerobaculia bacterium]